MTKIIDAMWTAVALVFVVALAVPTILCVAIAAHEAMTDTRWMVALMQVAAQ